MGNDCKFYSRNLSSAFKQSNLLRVSEGLLSFLRANIFSRTAMKNIILKLTKKKFRDILFYSPLFCHSLHFAYSMFLTRMYRLSLQNLHLHFPLTFISSPSLLYPPFTSRRKKADLASCPISALPARPNWPG